LKYLIENERFEFKPFPQAKMPRDYKYLSHKIQQGDIKQNPQVKEFQSILAQVDLIVEKAFDLTEEEHEYIHTRLSKPPFAAMQPRWPWEHVSIRPTRIYTQDRFLS